MLARRRMLGTTLFGGFLGATIPASDQSAQTSDRQLMDIVNALKDIRSAIEKKWASAAAHGTHTPTPLPPKP